MPGRVVATFESPVPAEWLLAVVNGSRQPLVIEAKNGRPARIVVREAEPVVRAGTDE